MKRHLATLIAIIAATAMQAQTAKFAEQMPSFPGGSKALIAYINNEMNYPKQCIKDKADGRASLNFVVTKEGDIKNVIVTRSSGNRQLDNEAIRLVKQMPRWTPGKQNGQPIAVSYSLPVTFKIKNASYKKLPNPNPKNIKHVEVDNNHDVAIVTFKNGTKKGYIVSDTPKLEKLINKNVEQNNITPDSNGYFDFFLLH